MAAVTPFRPFHPRLHAQLESHGVDPAALPAGLGPLLAEVSAAYLRHDQEAAALRSTLERSSEELLRANTDLCRSVSLLQAALESTADGLVIVDEQGRVTHFNARFVEMWGIPTQALSHRRRDDPFPWPLDQIEEPDAFLDKVRDLTADPAAASWDVVRLKDGRVFERYSLPQQIEGETVGRVWSFRDVTERVRSEEELRDSERRLREAQRVAQVGSWEWEIATNTMTWSDELCRLHGLPPGYVPSGYEEFLAGIPPEQQPLLAARVQDAIENGRDFFFSNRLVGRDGTVRLINARGRAICDASGRPVRLVGTAQDVTELKQAEAALQESELRFRQMAEALKGGAFYITDHVRHTLLYISPGIEEIAGRSCQSLCGEPHAYLEAIHPEDREMVRNTSTALIRDGHKAEMIYRLLRPDGSVRWVRNRAFPLMDAERRLCRVTGMVEDITEQRALQERLFEAQKMDAVGRLAGGVAHDFNNLLTVILGCGEQLEAEIVPGSSQRRLVDEIGRAAQRAASLTAQLLAFSRRQVLKPVVLDLNAVVVDMKDMLRRVIGEDIDLTTDLSPDLGLVLADRTQIEQVILNLAVNARDAMPEGGQMILASHNVVEDAAGGGAANGGHAAVSVTDTGCGMDEETRTRIFEPFFTTKATGKGTGLGLATVYGIVRQSGGDVRVESAPGCGATFRVLLPRTSAPLPAVEAAPAERDKTRGSGTILLVEDEEAVRILFEQSLEDRGYTVLSARDAETALVFCRDATRSIDVLITDVVMPGLSGPKLIDQVVTLRPGIKVVMMSGYADHPVLRQEGAWQGGVTFVQKPFTPEVLAQKVREALER
jgi:PAS domain S-box-containing protein